MQDLKENRPQPAIRDRGERELNKKANKLERLVVEYVEPAELKPNSYNPNRQNERDFELLIKSITEDGFTQPIVAIREGKVIVDGEHRWRAAQKLGYVKVPVVFVDMTPEQMRVATLRHNRARGSEDLSLSIEVLRDLQELGALDWAKDSLMMDEQELNKLLSDIPITEGFAAETFSEAWVQVKEGTTREMSSLATQVNDNTIAAASKKAEELSRSYQQKIEAAPTQEAKAELVRNMADSTFRIAVSYMGDESKIVKYILGDRPAENLLKLCTAAAGA